jgi:hypothetical protein
MYPHAANPAATPHLSPSVFNSPAPSREECIGGCDQPSLSGAITSSDELASWRASAAEKRWDDSVQREPFRLASRPLLGVTLRAYPAPCGRLALLLWLRHPTGYGFRLRRTLRKCRASTLGAVATRWLCHV